MHFRLFSSKSKPGNGKSRHKISEKNEVEESKVLFFSQVIICVFERSGFHFHNGCECRLNLADVVPLTSIRFSHQKMLYSSCTKRSVVNIYSGSILVIQDYFIPQMLPINSHLSRSWTTQDAEKQAQERAGSQLSRHGYGGASFITQAALGR